MTKTMSIRMDQKNYEFLRAISREERNDLSKAVRDLVTRGGVLLAVERYRKGEASLGKAAELAGLAVGQIGPARRVWSSDEDRAGRVPSKPGESRQSLVRVPGPSADPAGKDFRPQRCLRPCRGKLRWLPQMDLGFGRGRRFTGVQKAGVNQRI